MLFLMLMLVCAPAFAQEDTGNNQGDGSTNQEGNLNTNNVDSTVNSNNNTTTDSVSNVYNGAGSSGGIPPNTAMAPSYMSSGLESCVEGISGSVQTQVFGIATGKYIEYENCNRRRDAKVLNDLNMKVAAVSRMCESVQVWRSMFVSGTPCPLLQNGKLIVGKRAYLVMKRDPVTYIPDYGDLKFDTEPFYRCRQYTSGPRKGDLRDCDAVEYKMTPRYTETQLWYNKLLGIGEVNEEITDNGDEPMSISERFRTDKG